MAGAHSALLTFIGLHIPLRTTRDFLTEDRMPFSHILCKRHHVTWILIFSVAFCFLYSFPSSSVLFNRGQRLPMLRKHVRTVCPNFDIAVSAARAPPHSKALVTGAAGFIGSHVAKDCLNLGFEVVAVDDLSGGFKRNLPAGVRFVMADLIDFCVLAGHIL